MEPEATPRGPLDEFFRRNESHLRILVGDPKDAGMDEEPLAWPSGAAQAEETARGADLILVEKDSKSKSLTTNDADTRDPDATGSKRSGRPRRERLRGDKLQAEERAASAAAKKHSNEDTGSRGRREFKNYDEMVASVRLLRFMDWEKVDPKVHQNSPCRIRSPRPQSAHDRSQLLVYGLLGLLRPRPPSQARRDAPSSPPAASRPDIHLHRSCLQLPVKKVFRRTPADSQAEQRSAVSLEERQETCCSGLQPVQERADVERL